MAFNFEYGTIISNIFITKIIIYVEMFSSLGANFELISIKILKDTFERKLIKNSQKS